MLIEDLDMDIVTHDVKKFFGLLLKKNGYVLEQLFSPLVVHTTPEHLALKKIAIGCITRHHAHHYLGFSETQWRLFEKERPRRVKPLLYVFRVLLTGIHLMKTGVVQANLLHCNEEARLPYIDDLVSQKTGGENSDLRDEDTTYYQEEYLRLRKELEAARDSSWLPEIPDKTTIKNLNELLVEIRLSTFQS